METVVTGASKMGDIAGFAAPNSEEWLRLTAEGSQLGLWQWDEIGQELLWDSRARAMFGAPETGPVTLECFYRALHPDDRSGVVNTWRKRLETGLPFVLDYRVLKPGGGIRWIQSRGSSYLDEAGKPLRMIGVVFDITERKRAEASLRESEARFRNMADTAPVMIWVVGPNRNCTFFNKRWLDFTGQTLENQLARGWTDGIHTDDADRCRQAYLASIESRRPFQTVFRRRRADGEFRWILSNGAPFDRAGEFAGFIGSCVDVTEQKLIEEQLQEYKEHLELLVERRTTELATAFEAARAAQQQAQSANQAKSEFLANMSHELRTPLNAILGFSSLLLDRVTDEDARQDLEIISRSGTHLLALINQVLDFSKIEAGHYVLETAPCNLRLLVRHVVDMVKVRAAEKHLTLEIVSSPNFPAHVLTDAAKLQEVLINLLGNAVNYTERGCITLRLNGYHTLGSQQVDLHFEVEDTGIGIAPGDHERVFKPFEQVGTSTGHKGTGLGLAITRHIVVSMHGSIQLQSALGKGSCFRVTIPTQLAPHPAAGFENERKFQLEDGQREYRILIVEDRRENWLVLERLLRRAGFAVRIAKSGQEGIDRFPEWQPHFIWMDLRMAEMDGYETTKRIRQLDGGAAVKIAAVSASGVEHQREQALAAGLDDFVRKPYRPSEIFDCMARQLGVRYRSDEGEVPPEVIPATQPAPDAIAALSLDLRGRLQMAVVSLDPERISAAIDEVAAYDGALASVLKRHAAVYSYTPILRALEAVPPQANQ